MKNQNHQSKPKKKAQKNLDSVKKIASNNSRNSKSTFDTKFALFKDYFALVTKQLRQRKKRSWLTLFGIIIGVLAIVSLLLIGMGLKTALSAQLDTLGSDILFINPKGSALTAGLSQTATPLTTDDKEIVEKTLGVKRTAGFIYTTGAIEYNDKTRYFLVYGSDDDPEARELIGEGQNFRLASGRAIEKGDKYKAVLAQDYLRSNLFEKNVELGDKIAIQGHEFKAVGFWQAIGNSIDDRSISIPIETYWEIFNHKKEELGFIIAEVETGEDLTNIKDKITKELRKHRDLEENKEDFEIQTTQQMAASFEAILTAVSAVLVGIAAISLFVGGVGIMNTMFTAVLERRREIGVLKAVGAKKWQILTLFLTESAIFGLIGGLIGVIIGISFAKSLEYAFLNFVAPNLFIIEINYFFLAIIIISSALFGVLCGYLPARKAANQDPATSLRSE